jgi:hypothetical protein
MSETLNMQSTGWLLPLLVVLLLAVIAYWIYYRRQRASRLDAVLNEISFERLHALVVPNADEGEILVDHLLLTSQGLLIVEIKDVQGVVFGGDKLRDWTVISDTGRYTFSNPQPGLLDRIAAVRQIVRDVPVSGRVLFPDVADFTKGKPDLVSTLAELRDEFAEKDKNAVKFKIEAFKPHWDRVRKLEV